MNKEFLFMVVFNFIIILSVMIYGLNHKGESKAINYNETNTYVQYIERSDNENHLPIAGITEEIYNMMPDQSLSEDTSLTDVTVTDSCQEISTYPEFTYSLDISEQDKYLLAKLNQCEAGNQNIRTRELVVLVVLNRVNISDNFPDTIEEVIKENHNGTYQFSPLAQGGSWYNTEPTEEAYIAVDNVLNSMYDYSGGALYFESCEDEDNWHSRNLEFLYKSGDIRFYK